MNEYSSIIIYMYDVKELLYDVKSICGFAYVMPLFPAIFKFILLLRFIYFDIPCFGFTKLPI